MRFLKNIFSAIFLLTFLSFSCTSQNNTERKILSTQEDSLIFERIINQFESQKKLPTAVLVVKIGESMIGTPYVASTLENGEKEDLVINLKGQDCTTFAEYCLAMAKTIKSGKTNFEDFANEMEKIRYRNGIRNGYTSRLHYFSDWIYDNCQKGLAENPASAFGSLYEKEINFMSTHPDSYPVLRENPDLVSLIAQQEDDLSNRGMFYLKKEDVEANETDLREGDIVGITTSIAGLDIAHVGILVKKDGRIHLLNASTLVDEITISDVPLVDFLMNKNSYTGIMIARPL